MIENIEGMIDCLCWFGYRNTIGPGQNKLSKLKGFFKKDNKYYYINDFGETFDKCIPAKLDEVRFYETDKYIEKIKTIKKENKKLMFKNFDGYRIQKNKKIGYIIVKSENLEELTDKVNKKLNDGWQLQGGICITSDGKKMQAMSIVITDNYKKEV